MNSFTLSSPAKINLFLRILSKRPDGFHDLATLMQTISLADKITFTISEGRNDRDLLTCNDPAVPTDATNLIFKAAELFRKRTRLNFAIKVNLEKRIPAQAGLGGGSGNAATTLWGLNRFFRKPLSKSELMKLAGAIGSDVAFFLSGGTAYCTGRGEQIKELEKLKDQAIWILLPEFGISTPEVYRNLRLDECLDICPEELLSGFLQGQGQVCNDLERPAFKVRPELEEIKRQLANQGMAHVLMSGSGSSFFCSEADDKGREPKIANARMFKANFINRDEDEWYC